MKLKVGERWVPKSGNPGGFVVLETSDEGIVVEVERRVPKDGEVRVEKRQRSISGNNDIAIFCLGYKKARK